MSFCKSVSNTHICIYLDNTSSCIYVNKYSGWCKDLDDIARDTWEWCIERNIYIRAVHIPGKSNIEADKQSRLKNEDPKWALKPEFFSGI